MITRHDLKELQALTKGPALSILLPTHRNFPENKQDPILVKNLVDQARERLGQEFSVRELEPLFNRLDPLVSEINYPHTLDGLALFVSPDFAKCYYLPFPVPTRVIIDQTFATRDLVYGMHRTLRYWVLLLSQASTRLLMGTGETLEEVDDQTFAMQMTGPGATTALPYNSDSSYMDDRHRRFFQQVDSAFGTYASDEDLPLIVGGVDRQISFFKEVSQYQGAIVGTLPGNLDRATIHELTPPVWELMQSVREQQQTEAMQELCDAVGARKVVPTIEEVWQLAQEGRGKRLLVEKNYHVPAVVTDNGGLKIVDQIGGTDVMDDAVDEIIEKVLAKGGTVVLVEDGSLSDYQRIALILRY
jgi:hypothetical protein